MEAVPVTGIGRRAVADKGIRSLEIGPNVESSGFQAFAGNSLSTITIPVGVHIGETAFSGNQLTAVILGDGVRVGRRGFSKNRLDWDGSTVTIGNKVELLH